MVATGSPFAPVTVQGIQRTISQCNNALIFPGIGLGILASYASCFTEEMLLAAIDVLSEHSPVRNDPFKPLLPNFNVSQGIAREIAKAVIETGLAQGVVRSNQSPEVMIDNHYWQIAYQNIRPLSE